MSVKKFGTFGGVFTPTILTIIGVIIYFRLGWDSMIGEIAGLVNTTCLSIKDSGEESAFA